MRSETPSKLAASTWFISSRPRMTRTFIYTMDRFNGQIIGAKPYMDDVNWTIAAARPRRHPSGARRKAALLSGAERCTRRRLRATRQHAGRESIAPAGGDESTAAPGATHSRSAVGNFVVSTSSWSTSDARRRRPITDVVGRRREDPFDARQGELSGVARPSL